MSFVLGAFQNQLYSGLANGAAYRNYLNNESNLRLADTTGIPGGTSVLSGFQKNQLNDMSNNIYSTDYQITTTEGDSLSQNEKLRKERLSGFNTFNNSW